ncbi:MAG: hypothetical protein H0T87_03700 [Gammaproteobacteria bacterium]|nr:hypothetical protein [Gammaproteobacteria bacterium]
MTSIIKLLAFALLSLSLLACGYDPPESSNTQGSTNAPKSEQEQASQPSVNQ